MVPSRGAGPLPPKQEGPGGLGPAQLLAFPYGWLWRDMHSSHPKSIWSLDPVSQGPNDVNQRQF